MVSAAGIAVSEGILSLDESLADCFPYVIPENSAFLSKVRLRHLLTMSSGFGKPLLMEDQRRAGTGAPDYLAFMFCQSVAYEPGRRFCYSTADSILAGRMIEQKTGKNLCNYLYERIFKPLDIGVPVWECCPMGQA